MEETLPEIRIPPARPLDSFTETELLAAELLVQLSESSGGDSSSSFSSSTSPRSVNARPPPMAMVAEDDRDVVVGEEEDDEIGGAPRRRRPRYRLLADLYAVTAPIGSVEKRRGGERQRGEKKMKGGK
ncbi:uncharacterized protein [Elaeis guineensis]|uniref:Uncharacterized protein LOC105055119 n=1 Tax=Elaeis guineensis var. tenera TaxID=51953 RepID=A0A6I9S0J1_ELAGV|nr:uncharacterized protein LOC105055119 [Elaeis guineensis]